MTVKPFGKYDVTCGPHSGFPRCCIAFFVCYWRQRTPDLGWWIQYNDAVREHRGGPAGYVMCPRCVAEGRTPVVVQRCTCRRKVAP